MTEDSEAVPSLDLARYVGVLRRRWLVTAVITLLGLVGAVGYLVVAPTKVTASTLVNINVISSTPFSSGRANADLVDTQTEVQLARSSSVIAAVADELGDGVTGADVRSSMNVEVLPEATVVRLSYTAGNEAAAVRGADAIADAYLEFRSAQASDRVGSVTDQLDQQRSDIESELESVNERLAAAPIASQERTRLESRRAVLTSDLESLVGEINSLKGIDTRGGSVLTTAADAGRDVTPRRALTLVTGLLAGLMFGIVAAFVVNVLDRRVRDDYDVAGAGGGLVLARLKAKEGAVGASGVDADAIWSLRERLLANLPADDPVLSIAETNAGHEHLDLEVNLAIAIAASGVPVELIVPEHTPALVDGVRTALQMSLHQESGPWRQFRGPVYPGLTLRIPSDTARRSTLPVDIVADLLRSDRGDTGMTMIALPPDASRSLVLAAGRLGHAVVLAVTESETRIDQLAGLATELRAVGATVHGSVMLPKGRRMVGADLLVAEWLPPVDDAAPAAEPPEPAEPAEPAESAAPDEPAEPDEPVTVGDATPSEVVAPDDSDNADDADDADDSDDSEAPTSTPAPRDPQGSGASVPKKPTPGSKRSRTRQNRPGQTRTPQSRPAQNRAGQGRTATQERPGSDDGSGSRT